MCNDSYVLEDAKAKSCVLKVSAAVHNISQLVSCRMPRVFGNTIERDASPPPSPAHPSSRINLIPAHVACRCGCPLGFLEAQALSGLSGSYSSGRRNGGRIDSIKEEREVGVIHADALMCYVCAAVICRCCRGRFSVVSCLWRRVVVVDVVVVLSRVVLALAVAACCCCRPSFVLFLLALVVVFLRALPVRCEGVVEIVGSLLLGGGFVRVRAVEYGRHLAAICERSCVFLRDWCFSLAAQMQIGRHVTPCITGANDPEFLVLEAEE